MANPVELMRKYRLSTKDLAREVVGYDPGWVIDDAEMVDGALEITLSKPESYEGSAAEAAMRLLKEWVGSPKEQLEVAQDMVARLGVIVQEEVERRAAQDAYPLPGPSGSDEEEPL